jgi:hypothetical protein
LQVVETGALIVTFASIAAANCCVSITGVLGNSLRVALEKHIKASIEAGIAGLSSFSATSLRLVTLQERGEVDELLRSCTGPYHRIHF